MITDITQLFFMATGNDESVSVEEKLWAEIILKVMHTIVHIDRDLRANYFSVIQTQVFDRFYKYVYRDENNVLYLGERGTTNQVMLVDFQTKSKKTRDSVIIKLLHKAENVAEELFDRVGVRFVTDNKLDALGVIKFLLQESIVIPHNIKPSRSVNTLIDMDEFKRDYIRILKQSLRGKVTNEQIESLLHAAANKMQNSDVKNPHSAEQYHAIQFTCRQMIRYKNPIYTELSALRNEAKKSGSNDEFVKKFLSIDISSVGKEMRFFYPFEIQIVDKESHHQNTEGEASHQEYKKSQLRSALKRVFKSLLEYKRIEF